MDLNTINGVVRALVPAMAAYFVGKGWLGAGAVPDLTAAVIAIVAAVWSVQTDKPTA